MPGLTLQVSSLTCLFEVPLKVIGLCFFNVNNLDSTLLCQVTGGKKHGWFKFNTVCGFLKAHVLSPSPLSFRT